MAVLAAAALIAAPASAATTLETRDVYARFDSKGVTLGNAVVERRWSRERLRTTSLFDKRSGGRRWSAGSRDFVLRIGGAEVGSNDFRVASVALAKLARGGIRATMRLTGSGAAAGLAATRVAEAYPHVAGFRTQTTLTSATPLVISSATLDLAEVGSGVTPLIRAFRAGADWREPGYSGPPLWVGYAQGGDFRQDIPGPKGGSLEANAEWIDARAGGRSLFMVMERNDLPSSRAGYDGNTASVRVDYTKDVINLGPLEEQAHFEHPTSGGGRARRLTPGQPFRLEAAFTGFSVGDADTEWQWHRYLAGHRSAPYRRDVTWNSDKTDENLRSTGAKDDMNLQVVQEMAPIARRLGVETFILDDGWASRHGDWQPNSPQYPDPRWDGVPGSKFSPRYPDATFAAVRKAIAPMRLGLWMSPLEFNPSSQTFASHPDWACHPIADGLAAYNLLSPDESSNEAGLVPWSNRAFPHIESRIRTAIVNWRARFFKFDFMVWLDCAGQSPNDFYEQHDEFLAMMDRLQRDHPDVVLQTDETNDYRLFPFESPLRGPSWFQNGTTSDLSRLLHNLWLLGPYVPSHTIGQHALGGDSWKDNDVNTLMAAALPSAITFWTDLRKLPATVIDTAAPWMRFYKEHRDTFALATFALLSDPLGGKSWAALQKWDRDRQRGALLAFRQDAGATTKRIPLRGVRRGLRFNLYAAPSGRKVGTATSDELIRGLDVSLAKKGLARVLLIEPTKKVPPPIRQAPEVLPERHRCLDRRRFTFRIHHSRGARAVEVYAYVNGKLVLHKRGRNIKQITLKRLPKGKFKVRIETFQSNGNQTISVRRYNGCKKSEPRTWRGPGRDPD